MDLNTAPSEASKDIIGSSITLEELEDVENVAVPESNIDPIPVIEELNKSTSGDEKNISESPINKKNINNAMPEEGSEDTAKKATLWMKGTKDKYFDEDSTSSEEVENPIPSNEAIITPKKH